MTKNRNQANRANQPPANKKTTDTTKQPAQNSQTARPSDVEDKKPLGNQPAAEKQPAHTAQDKKPANTNTKATSVEAKANTTAAEAPKATHKPEQNAQAKPAEVKSTSTATGTQKAVPKTTQPPNQASKEKSTAKGAASTTAKAASKPAEVKKENSNKQAAPKTEPKKSEPPQPPQNNKAPEDKKSGKGLALLALLLGVAGTGLGAYSYNELRTLKAATATTTDYSAKITVLEKQLQELSNTNTIDKQKQISDLISQVKALKTSEAGFSERIAQVEQAQVGVVKNTSKTLDQQLSTINTSVADAQQEIENIKLGQQGLAKNISELTAGGQSVSESGMSGQEVGYLLRMANFKLASERDLTGAAGLLQMAADRLVAANDDKNTALIDAIRATTIQLQGVTLVDENTLFIQLGQISRDIPLLVVKTDKPAATEAGSDAKGESEAKESASAFDKALAVFASGVKYTPKDPSKIDISAETVLIEKRLMQADIKTAELAIRTHNKTLLSESFRAVRDKLNNNFANDKTAQTIKSALSDIEQSELTVVLPSLSGLVKQFEQAQ